MQEHLRSIDILRIIAIFGVLLQHSATEYLKFNSDNPIGFFYKGLTCWNIIVFVMITGILFIKKNVSYESMWKKYILRIIKVFCFWSLLYTCYNCLSQGFNLPPMEIAKNFVCNFISGGDQRMWYLVMLVGLYAIMPIISEWCNNTTEKGIRYALIIGFLVMSVLPSALLIPKMEIVFGMDYNRLKLAYPGIILIYAVFGYYLFLNREKLKTQKLLIIILGLISLIVCGTIQYLFKMDLGIEFVLIIPICTMLFLLSDILSNRLSEKTGKIINNVANCSFGMYLIHTFLQIVLNKIGFSGLLFNVVSPWIGIPIYTAVLFAVSFISIRLIRCFRLGKALT